MLAPPPDVVVARTLRSLTRALLVCCGAALALGLLAVAILSVAEGSADGLASGLVLLGVGQAGAIAGAGVVGFGLRQVVGRAPHEPSVQRRDASAGVRPGAGAATPQAAEAAAGARETVGRRLGRLARGLAAVCVLLAATWTLVDAAAALGALLGTLVSGQVALALLVVHRRLTSEPAAG